MTYSRIDQARAQMIYKDVTGFNISGSGRTWAWPYLS